VKPSAVREWLRSAAREAGTPEALRTMGEAMSSPNTRSLVLNFAKEWESSYKVLTRPHWASKNPPNINPLDHIPT
jgi:hypothetical protein